jgi:DeoR/GlpR family transcriptional regulator of sugar metabolism
MWLLSRVHGDTIVLSGIENIAYEARRLIAQNEKRAIGIAAAKIIANNASLFINIGTTIEEVARARRTRDLLVIANDLNVAMPLYRHPWIEVIVAGAPHASIGRRGDRLSGRRFRHTVQGRFRDHRCVGHRRGRIAAGL